MATHKETLQVAIETKFDIPGFNKSIETIQNGIKGLVTNTKGAFQSIGITSDLIPEAAILEGLQKVGGAIVDFVGSSIDEYKNLEVANGQLQNTLEDVGKGQYFEQITDNIKDLSKQFGISVTDLTKSRTKLEESGKLTEKQIDKSQQNIIDYSRRTGKSIEESTDIFEQAYNGRGRSLKEFGVNLDKNATVQENYAKVTEQITKRLQGSAEDYNNTLAGSQDKFETSVEELKDTIGKGLEPIVKGFYQVLTPLIDLLGDGLSIAFNIIKDTINGFLIPFKILISLVKKVGDLISPLVDKVKDLAKHFIDLGKNALGPVIKYVTQIYDKLVAVFDKVKSFLGLADEAKAKADQSNKDGSGDDSDDSDDQTDQQIKKAAQDKLDDLEAYNQTRANKVKEGSKEESKIIQDNLKSERKFYEDNYEKLGLSKAQFDLKVSELDKQARDSKDEQDKKDVEASKKLQDKRKSDAAKSKEQVKKEIEERKKVRESELKSTDQYYETKLNLVKEGSKEETEIKTEQLDAEQGIYDKQYKEQIKDNELAHSKGLISDDDYNQAKLSIESDYQLQLSKITKESKQLKDDQDKKDKEKDEQLIKDHQDEELDNLEFEKGLIKSKHETALQASSDELALDKQTRDIKNQQALDAETIALQNLELTEQQKEDIKQKYGNEILKNNQAISDSQKQLSKDTAAAQLKDISDVANATSDAVDLFGENTAAAKAINIAKALINTYTGVSEEIAAPGTFFEKLPSIIAIAAAGFSNVKKIVDVQIPEHSSSAPSTSAPSSFSSISSPQLQGVGQGTPQGNNQQQNTKVYVSEQDITRVQNKVSVIQSRATISH